MKRNSAFTLAELLVATGIFLLIGVMLVGMLHSGLEVWHRGEARRDVYERGQVILDMLARDLAAAWVDREPASSKDRAAKWEQDTPPWDRAGLFCDRDALGRQRVVLTKRGRPDHGAGGEVAAGDAAAPPAGDAAAPPDDAGGAAAPAPAPAAASEETGQVVQVVYVMDPEPSQLRLWRGSTVFGGAALTPQELGDAAFVRGNFALVSTGVLDVEYRFWTPDTSGWENPVGSRNGPSSRWDSSRGWDDRSPYFLADRTKIECPDILPAKVLISIILLPEADREHGTTLNADLDPTARKVEVDSTKGFPDAPGCALIDGEWFTYSAKDATTFTVDERAARGSRSASHAKGARVVSGETLSTIVYLPCKKEPRKDEERR